MIAFQRCSGALGSIALSLCLAVPTGVFAQESFVGQSGAAPSSTTIWSSNGPGVLVWRGAPTAGDLQVQPAPAPTPPSFVASPAPSGSTMVWSSGLGSQTILMRSGPAAAPGFVAAPNGWLTVPPPSYPAPPPSIANPSFGNPSTLGSMIQEESRRIQQQAWEQAAQRLDEQVTRNLGTIYPVAPP